MSILWNAAGLAALLLAGAAAAFPGEAAPEPPDARFSRAERLFAAGEIEKAYELYESVGKADPARWGARTSARMTEIKKLVSGREGARARAKSLAEAADASKNPGEFSPWLRYEAARELYGARLFEEARAGAELLLEKHPDSRHRAAGLLLLGRSLDRLGRADDAVKAFRQVLAVKGTTRSERAEAWRELDAQLSRGGRDAEYREMLEEQVRRGAEEPGAEEAAERYFSLALAGPKEAVRAAKLVNHLIETWPAGSVRAEWALLAAKVAEYVERDHDRAERLYRLAMERYPQAAFDLRALETGKSGAEAGRETILAALARVADKKSGKLKELEIPKPDDRGKTPEKALAAVLAALRAGDPEAAKSAAGGTLLEEIAGGRCDFARYGLSDYRPLGAARKDGDAAELDFEVSGELGVTRVLKKRARAGLEGGAWKILDLGF